MTVINAINPAEILASFSVCQTHLLCIASVPGATAKDYEQIDTDSILAAGDSISVNPEQEEKNINNEEGIENNVEGTIKSQKEGDDENVGKVTFVSIA